MESAWEEINEVYTPRIELLVPREFGVNTPRQFVKTCNPQKWGIKRADIELLLFSEISDEYWETWRQVIRTAQFREGSDPHWCLADAWHLYAIRSDYLTL
jgi:hypothetical protein